MLTKREYALTLLKECNCELDTYMDGSVIGGYENALKDLKSSERVLPYPAEDIARELVAIGNENRPPEPYPFPEFDDWGHWGISDSVDFLYDKGEMLQDAIKSERPFDTGWHGFKKRAGKHEDRP